LQCCCGAVAVLLQASEDGGCQAMVDSVLHCVAVLLQGVAALLQASEDGGCQSTRFSVL